jgi:hypothetical protein
MERSYRQRMILQLVGVVCLACLGWLWFGNTIQSRSDSQHVERAITSYGVFGYYFLPKPQFYFVSIIIPEGLAVEEKREYMARWYAQNPPPPEPTWTIDAVGLTLTLLATATILALFIVAFMSLRKKRLKAYVAIRGWRYA